MSYALLIIAGLGAIAVVVSKVARRFVPEIVIFLALGFLIGPEGPFEVINESNIRSLNLLTQVALGLIIFLIGDRLRIDDLRGARGVLAPVNLVQIVGSSALVFFAVQWAGADVRLASALALIAAETGVLTVTATAKEERAAGRYTDLLLSSVAVTNVAVATLFGLAYPFILASTGEATSALETALVFAQIVIASAVIGLIGGWLLRVFGPAIETSGELLLYLLIVVTGMVGGAVAVGGSVVVSTLIAGLYVANAAPWLADRLFAAIRTLEAPIYLIFFVVAGASIHLDELASVGAVGAAYLVARAVGKVAGSTLGALVTPGDADGTLGFRLGLGLLPHAGMAIALVAFVVETAPGLGESLSAVVLGSIVVFELAGPIVTRRALRSAGDTGKAAEAGDDVLPDLDVTRSFRRLLVPVGSIEILMPRLAFLLDLVGNIGAEMVAVHVSRPGSGLEETDEPEVLELVRRVAEERNIPCTTVHRVSEQIARSLVQTAREREVDLIVMGEPARTTLLEPTRWGLVAQRVVRDVDVPVLVYPVDSTRPDRVPNVYLRRATEAAHRDAEAGTVPASEDLAEEADTSPEIPDRA